MFYLFFFLIPIITPYETCKHSFKCSRTLPEGVCLQKKRTDVSDKFEVLVGDCGEGSCDAYDLLISDEEEIKKCPSKKQEKVLPSYSGGTCRMSTDCLNGICINNTCIDSKMGSECHSHENCPLNTACINNNCKNYLKVGEKCDSSFECEFDAFCNLFEHKCMRLFSIEDGVNITGIVDENEVSPSYVCKSGDFIEDKITIDKKTFVHNYCDTVENVNINCETECEYNSLTRNKTYKSDIRCLCGFNRHRSSYCVLGNSHLKYKVFFDLKKAFVTEGMTSKCHTLERTYDDICHELVNTNKTISFRNFTKNYHTTRIAAKEAHRIQDTESCVKQTFFDLKTSFLHAVKQSCPIFKCSKREYCLFGYNPANEDGKGINFTINEKVCNKGDICKAVNGEAMDIMEKRSVIGSCIPFEYTVKPLKRYPGEECETDDDCINDYSNCVNKVCSNSPEYPACNSTRDCPVGKACMNDTGSPTCKDQKDEGESCENGWDCKNYLGCYRNRCIKFGSLKTGMLNDEEIANFTGNQMRQLLCASEHLDEAEKKFCVDTEYDMGWIKDEGKIIDDKGFVKCDYGEICKYHYVNKKGGVKMPCGCGYNEEGQGYCPVPTNRRKENWKERLTMMGEMFNNECHSMSRFECYKTRNYDNHVKILKSRAQTYDEHLFYKAKDCVKKVFIGSEYLYKNILSLLITIILL